MDLKVCHFNGLVCITVLVVTVLCSGCLATATHGAMSLTSMKIAKGDAQQNFYAAEDYRIQFNFEKAFQHYRYSAFGGNQESAMWVAIYYFDGIGTKQNYSKSRRLFEMIAWQDEQDQNDRTYLYLADIDFYGLGRPRAVIQGYKWMLIGTRNDPFKRNELKAKMEPEMSAQQIAKATQFAKKWLQWRDRDISGIE